VGLLFTDALGARETQEAIQRVVEGYYGLQAALFGEVEGTRYGPPSAARWLAATLLWGAGAAAAVGVAAYRRREE
jgi:hypothetical protein